MQWYPLLRLIVPKNENPKSKLETLVMVNFDSVHINEIGYWQKLANIMVIKNMQLFYIIDTRMKLFEFKNRVIP